MAHAQSLQTIHAELVRLRDAGLIHPPQFKSINAQLPSPDGKPSTYHDPNYGPGTAHLHGGGGQGQGQGQGQGHDNKQHEEMVQQIANHAQDPNHPAHPQHKDHGQWVKNFAGKLGNAAVFGAGSRFGSNIVGNFG